MEFVLFFLVVGAFGIVEMPYFYTSSKGQNESQYTSFYDTDHKTPVTCVDIYSCSRARQSLNHSSPDRPHFKTDPRLPYDKQANDDDYRGSGWTRGHLVTAKYYAFIHNAYYNTFFLTNVAPQASQANSKWAEKDEMIVLAWAAKNPNCQDYVIIQTAVTGNQGTIGKSKVTIPEYYITGLCEPNTGNVICFWEYNKDTTEVSYCSVADCESRLGEHFFETEEVKRRFPNCLAHKDHLDANFFGLGMNSTATMRYRKPSRE